MSFLFKTKKKRKRSKPIVKDEIDWNEETEANIEPLPETFQEEKKSRIPIRIPKGKALININRQSWIYIIMGVISTILNSIFLGISLLGKLPATELVLILCYTLSMIYISANFTWIKIQGEKVKDE